MNNATDRPAYGRRFQQISQRLEECASSETGDFPLRPVLVRRENNSGTDFMILPADWLDQPVEVGESSLWFGDRRPPTLLEVLEALPRYDLIRYTIRESMREIITRFDEMEVTSIIDDLKQINERFGHVEMVLLLQAIDSESEEEKRMVAAKVLFELVGWPPAFRPLYEKLLQDISCSMESLEELPVRESFANAVWILNTAKAAGIDPTSCGLCPDGGIGIAWGSKTAYADVECYNDGDIMFTTRIRGADSSFHEIDRKEGGDAALDAALALVRSLFPDDPN